MAEDKVAQLDRVLGMLPHRYPFLLVNRVLELEKDRVVAIKNVSINEPFFTGHFPGYPIMPGVLVVEAMAQAGGVLLLTEIPDRESKLVVFACIERAKFRRPVVPGDQLRIEVDVLNWRPRASKMLGRAFVEDKMACEAEIMCAVVPRVPQEASGTPKSPGPGGDTKSGPRVMEAIVPE